MSFAAQLFLQAFELYGICSPRASRCWPALALWDINNVLEMVIGEIAHIDLMQWPQMTQHRAYVIQMALLNVATRALSLALFHLVAHYTAKRRY